MTTVTFDGGHDRAARVPDLLAAHRIAIEAADR